MPLLPVDGRMRESEPLERPSKSQPWSPVDGARCRAASRVAIAGETTASETLEAKLQAAAARDALTESTAQCLQGLAPAVSVLAALAADQAAQLSLLDVHRSRLDARINLHLALGGQWRVPQESSP